MQTSSQDIINAASAMQGAITKIENGQEFTRIRYTNNGAHAATETWYPAENLSWLREHCDVEIVANATHSSNLREA